jgi:competence protein ComEA
MPTPAERQALVFLSAIAALGIGVNAWRATRAEPVYAGSKTELAAQIARVDSALTRSPSREARRKKKADGKVVRAPARPAPPAIIDLDVALAAAIESLPRIGPALAARMVANRDSFGPFGSLEGVQRVRGVGPSLVKAIAPLVRFSGVARSDAPTSTRKGRKRSSAP